MGDIPDTPGVHGIAFAPKLDKGFVSAGRANEVVVFDLKTLKPTGQKIATGQNPDAILYDEHSNRLFTFNGRSKDSTVIDPSNDSVVKTIPLGGKPEFAGDERAREGLGEHRRHARDRRDRYGESHGYEALQPGRLRGAVGARGGPETFAGCFRFARIR